MTDGRRNAGRSRPDPALPLRAQAGLGRTTGSGSIPPVRGAVARPGGTAPAAPRARRGGPSDDGGYGDDRYGDGRYGDGDRYGRGGYDGGHGSGGYGAGRGDGGYGGGGNGGGRGRGGGPGGPDDPFGPGGPGGPRRPSGRPGAAPVRKKFIDIPRAGRRGWTRWIPSWRLVTGSAFAGLLLAAGLFVAAYAATEIPASDESFEFQKTVVFWDDGRTVLGEFAKANRTAVRLDQVPEPVRRAVLAAEDRDFYTNQGISPTGILRAAWNNARGGSRQGGSTITQQYVKNKYNGVTDRSYRRKAEEFIIALKVTQETSKDDILQEYLNGIYWGRGAYGVQAASRAWFGKQVDQLTVSEAAFLAGIVKGPELYDPTEGKRAAAQARERWAFVLDGMVTQGWLSAAERADATFPKVRESRPASRNSQTNYLLRMVREEAKRWYTQKEIDTGGLRITTTFDKAMVDQAVRSVDETLGPRRTWPKGTQVALAAVDPRNGAVKAVYGGDGKRQTNAAAQDNAQAGSTFKPFTLIAYLEGKGRREPGDCSPKPAGEESGSLRARFDGRNNLVVGGVKVRNFGSRSFGRISVSEATANSVNSVYVAMNEEAGPAHTRAVAECAGLPEETPGLDDENLFNVLGTSSPHPLDMAGAYATIAAQGERHPRHVIDSISVRGKQGYRFEDKPEQVFDPDVVADATYAMQQVVRRGSGEYARRLGFPTAGKTGTSNANRSAWFVGFDAGRLATAVTLYRVGEDGAEEELEGFKGAREITGGSLPVRVWTDFMDAALEGQERRNFPQPVYGGGNAGAEPEYTPPPTQEPEPEPTRPTEQPQPTQEPQESPTPTPTDTPSPSESPGDEPEGDPGPTETDAEPSPSVEPTPGATRGRMPRPPIPTRSP